MIKPMAHDEAETMNAVDLYLLNELTEEQRLSFEEHYFECVSCAQAVEAGQAFLHGIRPVLEPRPWWRRAAGRLTLATPVPLWRHWAYGGITALSLIGLGLQRLSFVSTSKLQANTIVLAREREKGGEEEKAYTLKTPSVTVELSLPPEVNFSYYRIAIYGDGKTPLVEVVPTPTQEFDRRLSLQAARSALGDGHFTVKVEGLRSIEEKDGSEVGQYYFAVKH